MVLAMFVDSGQAQLLSALADGRLVVTPSILEPSEHPPFHQPPASEFARGLYEALHDLADPVRTQRARARSSYYRHEQSGLWTATIPSASELRFALQLQSPSIRVAVQQVEPNFRFRRIDPGEAECAAVAITRGWILWSDDQAIVTVVRTLYPTCQVERTCGLLVRAVAEGLISCADAMVLYNQVFKQELGLYSTLRLVCQDGNASCQ